MNSMAKNGDFPMKNGDFPVVFHRFFLPSPEAVPWPARPLDLLRRSRDPHRDPDLGDWQGGHGFSHSNRWPFAMGKSPKSPCYSWKLTMFHGKISKITMLFMGKLTELWLVSMVIYGWWFFLTILKNDGVRQWVSDDIPYMKWTIKHVYKWNSMVFDPPNHEGDVV